MPMLAWLNTPAAWNAANGTRMKSQSTRRSGVARVIEASAIANAISVGSGVFHRLASR